MQRIIFCNKWLEANEEYDRRVKGGLRNHCQEILRIELFAQLAYIVQLAEQGFVLRSIQI